ncbi:MAG: hypothetical protein LW884_00510 [Bacteroidetes bacterium]|jgi:hypothetical protein|nr:hypothetical protein [Bacteroidota bacterium]
MIPIVDTPKGHANAALAYFFRGLINADDGLSATQEKKIETLIYKMRNGLPGDYESIIDDMRLMKTDPDYASWEPLQFANTGLAHFDLFVESGEADDNQVMEVIETMDIIMEIGEVNQLELAYMKHIKREFDTRYAAMIK